MAADALASGIKSSVAMLLNMHNPDNKVHGAAMGPTWVLSAPDGQYVGPMNLTIRVRMSPSFNYPGFLRDEKQQVIQTQYIQHKGYLFPTKKNQSW